MTYENRTIGVSRWFPTRNRKVQNRLQGISLVIMFLVTLGEWIGVHELSRWFAPAWEYKNLTKKTKITLLLWQLLKECNTCPSISFHTPKIASLLHFLRRKIRFVLLQSKTVDKVYVFTSNSLKGTLYTCNEPSRSTLRALAPLHALCSSGMIPDQQEVLYRRWSPINHYIWKPGLITSTIAFQMFHV